MPWTSEHIKWLINTKKEIITNDGKIIQLWEFRLRMMRLFFPHGQSIFEITTAQIVRSTCYVTDQHFLVQNFSIK